MRSCQRFKLCECSSLPLPLNFNLILLAIFIYLVSITTRFGHVFLKRLWTVLKRQRTRILNLYKYPRVNDLNLLNTRSPPIPHCIMHVYTDYTDILYTHIYPYTQVDRIKRPSDPRVQPLRPVSSPSSGTNRCVRRYWRRWLFTNTLDILIFSGPGSRSADIAFVYYSYLWCRSISFNGSNKLYISKWKQRAQMFVACSNIIVRFTMLCMYLV